MRVLDFGLAQIQQAETLTAQGDVPGTLAYIAPERLAGALTTEAADVWAVGLMLWEALAGRHPFWRSSLLETARAIEAGAPRLETVRPDLPKPLLAAVNRALDLDPARRPSAAALAETVRLAARKRRVRKSRGSDPGRSGRGAAARPRSACRNRGRLECVGAPVLPDRLAVRPRSSGRCRPRS